MYEIQLKFITFETMLGENMILFPESLSHHATAQGYKPISAGFVRITIDSGAAVDGNAEPLVNIKAYGESTTLGLQARPKEDTSLARAILRNHF